MRFGRIEDVLRDGMERFLGGVLAKLVQIGAQIDRHFLLTPETVMSSLS
jgi:hypothetical protein